MRILKTIYRALRARLDPADLRESGYMDRLGGTTPAAIPFHEDLMGKFWYRRGWRLGEKTLPRVEEDPPAREDSPPDSPARSPRYGDWRDEIAANYPTSGLIPEHPWAEFGLWYDSGVRTGDDGLRCAISSAEAMGFSVEPEYRELVDGEGWTDPETNDAEILHDIEQDATNYINAVLSAYGVDGWVGWDGDIGGFGLWESNPED